MGFSTFYDGKVISVPVTAGNNSAIADVDNIIVTFTIPAGLRYNSSTLPQGTFDPESNIWTVGTIAANTTIEAEINFIAVDSDIYIGEELDISWVISSIDVDPDGVPSNNTQTYTITPINCNEIEDCIGCASLPIFYECKRFVVYVSVNNITPDIQEDVKVNFQIPGGLGLKTAVPTHGTASLGEDEEGNLSSFNVVDNPCPDTYYDNLVWRIPTLPAATNAEIALTFYIIGPLDNCDKIEWEIVHEVEGSILHGLRNGYSLRGVEGEDLKTSIGYKEWAGKLIYLSAPLSFGGVNYLAGYAAIPYNKGTVNYLGDYILANTSGSDFTLTSDYSTLTTDKVIVTEGTVFNASGHIIGANKTSATVLEVNTDCLDPQDLELTVSIKLYL